VSKDFASLYMVILKRFIGFDCHMLREKEFRVSVGSPQRHIHPSPTPVSLIFGSLPILVGSPWDPPTRKLSSLVSPTPKDLFADVFYQTTVFFETAPQVES
jgi:hypothetical protein